MYIFILIIFILKISINIAFPSSENLLNNTNSYGLDLYFEFKTGGFDFNGDGKQDFIISDFQTQKLYVFFGDISRYGDKRPLKVSMIDGMNGFSIDFDKFYLRNNFICGDINDDGYDEIIFRRTDNQLFIIYGHAGPFKNDFSTFDGIGGFVINNVNVTRHAHFSAYQVLCDHNGDGIKDLIYNTLDDVYVLYGLDRGRKYPTNSGVFYSNFVSNGTYGHTMQKKQSVNFGCGDLNNDGIDDLVILSDTDTATVTFGLKIYPTKYNPVLNGSTGFTMKIESNLFVYLLQMGFGDLNGDGLQDMAVASKDSKSIYMIYGKKGGIWESHFDINSGNSSEVVKLVRDASSPLEFCSSMYVGDINGDGISDLSCTDSYNEINWGVYGTTMKLPAVYDLNIKTSPLFGDCRGFIILNSTLTFSAWTDFNNDGFQDLILQFNANNMNYILFGEKTKISESLNIINTSIPYHSNGEYRFLESNFNPSSSACNVQFITFKVLGSIDASDQLSFSPNTTSSVVSISNGELQVFNTNSDPKFLQSLSNILYKTNRNSSIVTISISYLNIINDTIKIFTSNPTINTTSTSPVTGTGSSSATGTGSSSATGTGSSSATGTGSSSATGTGSSSATGTGSSSATGSSSTGTGSSSATGTGSSSATGAGSSSATGTGSSSATGTGSSSATGTGSSSATGTGSSATGTGSSSATGTGSSSSATATGSSSATGTGSSSATGTGPSSATATGSSSATGTGSSSATGTGTSPVTATATSPVTSTARTGTATTLPSTVTSTQVLQNNTVNNDCICIRGQICLPDSHICVNEFDVYQGESCLQNSCALGYDCKEDSNQIYKCVKQDSCITCADITCKSPHRCILVLSTSQKCKYQPTCSN
ncbi:tenascin X [Tieghemostelium lacteum]|uniref:Tenascin X n=1 Tax=Tieghemostelium lacteum TaxID=361077 RepID=A0A151Z464_TIELA|nr:tenascin X [Tieghemostelium lacteum]|eukprot:KYQ88707.1 tenascin X [Tieghemostelium lacteum]